MRASAAREGKRAGRAEVSLVINAVGVRRVEVNRQLDAGRRLEMFPPLDALFGDHLFDFGMRNSDCGFNKAGVVFSIRIPQSKIRNCQKPSIARARVAIMLFVISVVSSYLNLNDGLLTAEDTEDAEES